MLALGLISYEIHTGTALLASVAGIVRGGNGVKDLNSLLIMLSNLGAVAFANRLNSSTNTLAHNQIEDYSPLTKVFPVFPRHGTKCAWGKSKVKVDSGAPIEGHEGLFKASDREDPAARLCAGQTVSCAA